MINKTGSKLIFYLFASLFFLSLVSLASAQSDSRVIIKQVTDYDLKRPCFNNGTYCSDAAVCTISIIRQPQGTFIVSNLTMTNNQTYHNVTLTKAQTDTAGLHDGIMTCTDGGVSGEDTFDVLISPSGSDDDSLRNIILLSFGLLFSMGIIIFGFDREDPWLIMFGGMALFVFGLYTLLNGVGNYRNSMTEWTSLIILSVASYITFRTGVEAMDENF